MICGVIYVATGIRFLNEAVASLSSLKMHMPDLPIVLWTDMSRDCIPQIFQDVQYIDTPSHSFADKLKPMSLSPFEKTIFLDTDTYICRALDDVFRLLDHVDMAAAHAPMRVTWPQPEIPDSFAEVNSGVLAWRKNERTDRLFSNWQRFYERHVTSTGQKDDQPSLRKALFESDVRLGILPPEYNFRTVLPGFCGRGVVSVIHGRHPDLSSIERKLNRYQGCRVVVPGNAEFVPPRLIILSGSVRWFVAPIAQVCFLFQATRKLLTMLKRRLFG